MLHQAVILGIGLSMVSAVASADQADARMLRNQYRQFSTKTKPVDKNLPLRIRSLEQGRRLHVDIFGVINHPYPIVANALRSPAAMCDFLIINMNVKACTYKKKARLTDMVIYVAGKNYTPLYRTLEIEPYFELQKESGNYLRVLMASQKGKWGMKEYSVFVEAAPYGKETLVRFLSNYHASRINKAATIAYLKTFARKKVGFTVIGHNEQDLPQYVRGMRGVIERNAVRSYLALQAYLETANISPKRRFESQLRRWFELTDVYTRQLHEMRWKDYLHNKKREYQNQLRLQQRILSRASRR